MNFQRGNRNLYRGGLRHRNGDMFLRRQGYVGYMRGNKQMQSTPKQNFGIFNSLGSVDINSALLPGRFYNATLIKKRTKLTHIIIFKVDRLNYKKKS